jgi:2-polyprenyl-3-methyl-5-hydroxy-6-metoxy-1,4-benzoquinol methylase
MEEFKITEEMKKYISLQRTGIKSNFEKRYFKEINYHWETIKEKCQSINSVLDIGCGIGGIDYFIAKNNTNCQINLLDKTKIENEVYYGFKEKGAFNKFIWQFVLFFAIK